MATNFGTKIAINAFLREIMRTRLLIIGGFCGRAIQGIDRKFLTSAKKFANFNEFSEIKKIPKKFVKCPSVGPPQVPVGYQGNKLPV